MSANKQYQFDVRVKTEYLEEQSDALHGPYVFAYTIRIRNTGAFTAKLLSRHWIIKDATDHVEEVEGPGVVGQQPVLRPGESFEYTSGCPLATPIGFMKGIYHCLAEDGTAFQVPIDEFLLSMPRTLH
ncbi:MAG: Co2+/Mg2+ efflux protein ApaG [Burkholderiaceae bacterium]|jgi:ApaG protein